MTPARLAAARVLLSLDRGKTTLSSEIERTRWGLEDRRDRGLFLEIVTGTIRWRSEVDAWLAACSSRPLPEFSPEVRTALRLGAYQLLHLDKVPVHAVVSESVELVRTLGHDRSAGFVNAVLRALLRRRGHSPLPKRPDSANDVAGARAYLSTTLSHPDWLVGRWLARYGFERTEQWCRFNNSPPELTVRLRTGTPVEPWFEGCRAAGIQVESAKYVRTAFRLPAGAISRMPEELARAMVIQDEASQLVAFVAGAQPGERVLDVCAAPGGKTAILADAVRPDGVVIAADRRPARIRVLRSTIASRGAHAPLLALDAEVGLPFGQVFDRVLLDAPCSGLGTLRRDPDLKWSRHEDDLARLAAVQRRMLAAAAMVVRPGGSVVYATCSSEPDENEQVVDDFLSSHREFSLRPLNARSADHDAHDLMDERGCFRTRPFRDGLDAFFAARLVRGHTA